MEKPEHLTLIPLFEELRGDRVIIRPYREEDAEALREAIDESRDHIRPWLPFADAHKTIEETRDWINRTRAKWILREDMPLGIWNAQPSRFLGGIGIHIHSWEMRYFEIGYWLRKDVEGHGYMTEAVRLLADFAMSGLEANRLLIRCDERNTHSAAVARRLGFHFEGVLRNEMLAPDGALRNTLVFSRIPGDPME